VRPSGVRAAAAAAHLSRRRRLRCNGTASIARTSVISVLSRSPGPPPNSGRWQVGGGAGPDEPADCCAIAYGRTSALGSIADDPDMGGTAISRHIVVLGGLARARPTTSCSPPPTPKGASSRRRRWLVSPTPRGTSALGRDVAIGAKIVVVSSQWSSAYSAANAVDGNLSTAWASNGDGDERSSPSTSGRERKITGFLYHREMSDRLGDHADVRRRRRRRRRYGPSPRGAPSTRT